MATQAPPVRLRDLPEDLRKLATNRIRESGYYRIAVEEDVRDTIRKRFVELTDVPVEFVLRVPMGGGQVCPSLSIKAFIQVRGDDLLTLVRENYKTSQPPAQVDKIKSIDMCYDSHDTPKVVCGMHAPTCDDGEDAVEEICEYLSEYFLSIGDDVYGAATCAWTRAYSDDGVMDYADENGMAFCSEGVETVFVGKK